MMSWTVLSRPVRAFGHSPERLARVFVLPVCASVLGITGWRVHLARELELTEADGTGTVALEQLRLHMAARVGAVARLHELSVHGPAGEWLASSLPTAPGGSVSDRAYFAHHRDSPGRGLFVGLPVQSRTDERWVVTASRRIDEPDGTFGGIAAACIDFDTFSTFYRSLDVGLGGSIALANTDGILLVRTPPRPEAVGQPLIVSLFADFRRMGPVGSTQGVSRLDGVRRWNSFRAVEGYPLVAFASLSEQDILAGWWDSAVVAMSAADLAARYGGEEFAVLPPDTDAAGALGMAERVCAAVRALSVVHGAAPDGVATVSVGVAVVWPQPPGGGSGQSAADLVRLADQALYRAKAAGRDWVCCDAEPCAEADMPVLALGG